MKLIIYLLSIVLLVCLSPTFVEAQCCPYLDTVQIIPDKPNESESIKVRTKVTIPNLGGRVSSNFNITDSLILITSCYYSGIFSEPETFDDTISLGKLAAKQYKLKFMAYLSDEEGQCIAVDSNYKEIILNVSKSTSADKISPAKRTIEIFPNPVSNILFLNLSKNCCNPLKLEVIDFNGRIVFVNSYPESNDFAECSVMVQTERLAPGPYFIKLWFQNDLIIQKFIKQ